ncbi:hypothetical protein [Streptomyces sp. LUP47B]|uniref:hypothetical protein n=1 Tax=Streptomyces sp. LUP47B TaxID=1890286 RepID=UPI001C4053FE
MSMRSGRFAQVSRLSVAEWPVTARSLAAMYAAGTPHPASPPGTSSHPVERAPP